MSLVAELARPLDRRRCSVDTRRSVDGKAWVRAIVHEAAGIPGIPKSEVNPNQIRSVQACPASSRPGIGIASSQHDDRSHLSIVRAVCMRYRANAGEKNRGKIQDKDARGERTSAMMTSALKILSSPDTRGYDVMRNGNSQCLEGGMSNPEMH